MAGVGTDGLDSEGNCLPREMVETNVRAGWTTWGVLIAALVESVRRIDMVLCEAVGDGRPGVGWRRSRLSIGRRGETPSLAGVDVDEPRARLRASPSSPVQSSPSGAAAAAAGGRGG